jgi:hypothetical protein
VIWHDHSLVEQDNGTHDGRPQQFLSSDDAKRAQSDLILGDGS